jgi:UrcA family protein
MFYGKALLMTGSTLAAVLASMPVAAAAPPARLVDREVVVVAERPDQVTRHVSYADLNLASVAGERALNRRIQGAVRGICSEAMGSSETRDDARAHRGCSKEARSSARPQVALAVQRARDLAATRKLPVKATGVVKFPRN